MTALRVFARLPFVASAAGEGEEAQRAGARPARARAERRRPGAARDRGRVRRLARPAARSAADGRAGAGLARRLAQRRAARRRCIWSRSTASSPGRRARRRGAERGARRGLADRAGRRLPSAAAAGLSAGGATAASPSSAARDPIDGRASGRAPVSWRSSPTSAASPRSTGAARAIKLSANELAARAEPAGDRRAAGERARARHRYPDGDAPDAARARSARRFQLDPGADRLRRGLGRADPAADARLRRPGRRGAPQRAWLPDLQALARSASARCRSRRPSARCAPTSTRCSARLTSRTRMVFLANPNNPTGSYLAADELARLHAGPARGRAAGDRCRLCRVRPRRNDYTHRHRAGRPRRQRGDDPDLLEAVRARRAAPRLAVRPAAPWSTCCNRLRGPFNVCTPAQVAGHRRARGPRPPGALARAQRPLAALARPGAQPSSA